MFNFIKKGVGVSERDREKLDRDEKDKRKREKKLRKEAKQGVSGSMSTEELLRLDEVRRSLKIRGRRKEKEKLPSGITADYSAEFFAQLDIDRGIESFRGSEEVVTVPNTTIDNNGEITSSSTSPTTSNEKTNRVLPPVPPKPPKRGILKGPRLSVTSVTEEILVSPEAKQVLMRNTLQNELMSYQNLSMRGGHETMSMDNIRMMDLDSNSTTNMSSLHIMTSPSPSAESLTDTTNSSYATPPFSLSPIGESQGLNRWSRVHAFDDLNLPLPVIKLVKLPPPRELVITRQKSPRNDFGFSLRKSICLDRSESLYAPVFKPVIFAEPGAHGGHTGLLPGDRLIKVNGTSVEDLPRETIIEMIRTSGDSVTVQVQPVNELVELSRRCMIDHSQHHNGVDDTDHMGNIPDCNTLRRSASKRFKQENRIFLLLSKRVQLEDLLKLIDIRYSEILETNNPEALAILKYYTQITYRFSIVNYCFVMLTFLIHIVNPYIQSKRSLPYEIYIPGGSNLAATPYFEIMHACEIIIAFACGFSYIACSNIFIVFITFGLVQIKILCQALERLGTIPSTISIEADLKQCIKSHIEIQDYIKRINDVFNMMSLVEFICFGIILSALLFLLVIAAQIQFIVIYVCFIFMQLYTFYYASDKLTEEGHKIEFAAYSSCWYKFDKNTKKIIYLIILRSQKPMQIMIGKIYPMNLVQFRIILNTSYSYFTLMYKFH